MMSYFLCTRFSNSAPLLAALFSILLPIFIIGLRSSIKSQRESLINELEEIYFKKKSTAHADVDDEQLGAIYPAFEFVKYKYIRGNLSAKDRPKEISIILYFISSVPLCLILLILGYYSFGPLTQFLKNVSLQDGLQSVGITKNLLWVVGYIGTYLYTLKFLLVSVENFDLTPLSFIAAAVNVLIGASATLVLTMAVNIFLPTNGGETVAATVFILGLFLVGYVPGLGLRTIMHYANFRLFKKFDADAYSQHLAIPVEVVDGIDSNISDRLSRFNIHSVQNLATVNPIMLFVETPYGIFAILDWVAQAQLCCVVGRKRLEKLWTLGIRTIFDLEQALNRDDAVLAAALKKILFSDPAADGWVEGIDDTTPPSKILKEFGAYVFDDLHVYRLRQIWTFLAKRLEGPAAGTRFDARGSRSAQDDRREA